MIKYFFASARRKSTRRYRNHMRKISTILSSILLMSTFNVFAIDNPGAPDRISKFKSRMSTYVDKANNASSTIDIIEKYYEYEQALDKELNSAYSFLMSRLDDDSKKMLRESQRQWIKYRNAEFAFIEENWTRANFGSSFVISRGSYKTNFIRERIIQLLSYSANYL
jgi:uncharacterized protein YecT (DUF1311 family)